MNKKTQLVLASLAATLLVAGCASGPSMVELNALTDKIVKASFRDQSHVKVERITATDETNRLCSEADAFVAASFVKMVPAAKAAFLVFGPMMDIKLMLMYTRVFRPRLIVLIVTLVAIQTFVLATMYHLATAGFAVPE